VKVFDEKKFQKRLTELVERYSAGKPGLYARRARKWDKTITGDGVGNYLKGRIPRVDKVAALAKAGNVTVGWLIGEREIPREKTIGTVFDEKLAQAKITIDPALVEDIAAGDVIKELSGLINLAIGEVTAKVAKYQTKRNKKAK
jgi:hypothetical protein